MKADKFILEEKKRQDSKALSKYSLHRSYAMENLLSRQFALIKKFISFEGLTLEIGCGIGDFLIFSGGRIEGIDISGQSVDIANVRLAEDGLLPLARVGDAYNLREALGESALFDSVIMRGTVHHLEDPERVFRNASDVLKAGGKLIILEGNASSVYRKFVLGITDFLKIEHEASQFPHRTPSVMSEMLKKSGFVKVDITFVPGLFAPFAYAGLGGSAFWKIADFINEKIARKIPAGFFGWWVLMSAVKE